MKIKIIVLLGVIFIMLFNIASAGYIEGGYIDDNKAIYGIPTYIRWDNTIQPQSNLNLNIGNYPYLYYDGMVNYVYTVDNVVLYIPKEHTTMRHYLNKISPELIYSKEILENKMINYNDTVAYLKFPYSVNQVIEYTDEHSIEIKRLKFIADNNHIIIKDSNDLILNSSYYDFKIINNEIRLYFNKQEANKLEGDISFSINSWLIGDTFQSWVINSSYNNTTINKGLSQIELDLIVNDYVSYYRFDGLYNTVILDDGDYNNTGTGTITTVAGVQNNAGGFNGATNYMDLLNNDDSLNNSGTNNFTISAWIYPDNISLGGFVMSNVPGAGQYKYALIQDTDDVKLGAWGGSYSQISNANSITANDWFHVVGGGIKNGSGYVYVNHSLQAGGLGNTEYSNSNINIGAMRDSQVFYEGLIDEVIYYNRTLDATEVGQLYNRTKFNTGNLSLWYDAGIGFESDRITANWTIPANTNYSIHVYNNDTSAFIETIANHATDTSFSSIINLPVQDTFLNISFYGNISLTPALLNLTFHTNSSVPCNDSMPPTPINMVVTNNQTSINWSVSAGVGNITDEYHKLINNTLWMNNSNNYYNLTGLTCNTTHNISFYAYNNSCNTSLNLTALYNSINTALCAVCIDYMPPSPINIQVDRVTDTLIDWSWSSGIGNISDEYHKLINGVAWVNDSNNYYNYTGLTCNSSYNITVYAYNNTCNGSLNVTGLYNSTNSSICPSIYTSFLISDPYNINRNYNLYDENYTLIGVYNTCELIPLPNTSQAFQLQSNKYLMPDTYTYYSSVFTTFMFLIFIGGLFVYMALKRRR